MHAVSVRRAVDRLAASRDASMRRLLAGAAVTAGAVLVSAVVARLHAPADDTPESYSDYQDQPAPAPGPSRKLFAFVWPPLFLALTLSGLRVWNAPASPARTQALTLWGVVQALNAAWMALGPRRLGGQLTAATASLGTSAAYVWRARKVDAVASAGAAPYAGWVGFANGLTGELRRRSATRPTLH